MSASHSLERVDSKTDQFCPACRGRVEWGRFQPAGARPESPSREGG